MTSTAYRWLTLTLLAVGVMISFIDRTSISTALAAPAFLQHFALSNLDRGWVNSAFFWSYAALQVPLGRLVDRHGVKWPYAACFAVWCAATASIGLATGFAGLIGMRLLVGAAEAVVVPATWRWIRDNFAEQQSGTAVGIFMLGNKIGPAIGAPIAASLTVKFGWAMMFATLGAAGAVWLVPWLLLVRNDKSRHSLPPHVQPARLAQLLGRPLIWGTLVVNFSYSYFLYYCMTWMPAYLVEQRGLSLARMGLYAFYSFAGIGIVALGGGWAADQLIRRGRDPAMVRKSFTIAGFVIASTVVLGAYTSSPTAALFWNVASLTGLGLATTNHLALCRITLIPAAQVGIVTGIQQVAAAMAGIIAPLLTGWLLHVSGNYDLAMGTVFVFLVLGALTTAVGLRRDPLIDRHFVAADLRG